MLAFPFPQEAVFLALNSEMERAFSLAQVQGVPGATMKTVPSRFQSSTPPKPSRDFCPPPLPGIDASPPSWAGRVAAPSPGLWPSEESRHVLLAWILAFGWENLVALQVSTYHRLLIKKVCFHFMSLEKYENSDSIYLSSLSISFLFLSPLGVMSLGGIDCGL